MANMTAKEKMFQYQLARYMGKRGYKTYAQIFKEMEFHLIEVGDPRLGNQAAFYVPKTGEIYLNEYFALNHPEPEAFCSMLIRHEILHAYLKHEKRLLDYLSKRFKLDEKNLDDLSMQEAEKLLQKILYGNSNFNIAADYEISNRGYTEKDKNMQRQFVLNGQVVRGLVTEDDHADWTKLSVEEMYEKLLRASYEPDIVYGEFVDAVTFNSEEGEVYGIFK